MLTRDLIGLKLKHSTNGVVEDHLLRFTSYSEESENHYKWNSESLDEEMSG